MKIILLALIIFNSSAWADPVKNMTEVAMLPLYCRGTQQIREITKVDPTEYGAIYGQSYNHLHHYCWALNAENKANMMFDKRARDVTLGSALLDIKYVLKNADADFVLLPEIYNSQARILFSLHSDSEAVLALEKAIELKPGYVPAVARLSDYFTKIGDKALAIKTLENGIDNTENSSGLIKKLEKLGKTYQGIPDNTRKKEEPANEQNLPLVAGSDQDQIPSTSSGNSATPGEATKQAAPIPTDNRPANKPYCRFCP